VLLCALGCLLGSKAWCQSMAETSTDELLEALHVLGSGSKEELLSARKTFESAVEQQPDLGLARIAIVFANFELRDWEEIRKSILELKKSKVAVPKSFRATIGRIQLCLAIVDGDRENAEKLFKGIVNAAMNEELPLTEKRNYQAIVGAIVGLLNRPDLKSPISQSILNNADHLMSKGKNAPTSSYQSSFDSHRKLGDELTEWLNKWDSDKMQARKQSLEELRNAVGEEEELLARTINVLRSSTGSHRNALRQNLFGTRKLSLERDMVVADNNTPTPGHPGPPPTPPQQPIESQIRVDEYETKYDKDGKKKEEKRPQSDIDRERKQEFQRAMVSYKAAKVTYDSHRRSYNQFLSVWNDRDFVRREELTKNFKTLTEKIHLAAADSKAHEGQQKQETEDFKELRDSLTERHRELRLAIAAADAMELNQPTAAYCGLCIDSFSCVGEPQKLVSALKERDE